jgi:AraC-like DNA-binding protein
MEIGTPVEQGFRQAGLPYSALGNIDNYVPSHRFWKFLVNMARSEGIMDLGFRVGERYGANSPDPRMTELLQQSPTVYSGLTKASDLSNRTISHCHIGIRQQPDSGFARFYHVPSCRPDNPAYEQIAWFGIMALIGMVRVYAGPQWQPAEIGITSRQPPCLYIRDHFPRTRIRLSQAYNYFTIENALFCQPPPENATSRVTPLLHEELLASDFAGTLEQALRSYVLDKLVSLDLAAALCNMSTRTLQRKLRNSGTHYNEVLGLARFRVASRLLQNPDLKVIDIAKRLGYSDAAHFVRAFRKVAGVTPKLYRKQFSH